MQAGVAGKIFRKKIGDDLGAVRERVKALLVLLCDDYVFDNLALCSSLVLYICGY
jgi:hypothetical protein